MTKKYLIIAVALIIFFILSIIAKEAKKEQHMREVQRGILNSIDWDRKYDTVPLNLGHEMLGPDKKDQDKK